MVSVSKETAVVSTATQLAEAHLPEAASLVLPVAVTRDSLPPQVNLQWHLTAHF